MRVVEEINAVLHELMDEHPNMYMLGEDLLDPYGGAFKATKGLSAKHPDRVLSTPISEAGIVGFGLGLALRGNLVAAEIMFGDFSTLIMDQLLNHASKLNWMFNGAVDVPLVVRAPMGGGRGYGPTHSQSIEKHFCGIPGLTVLAPSAYRSPGALLKSAFALRSPVLFVENKIMYSKLVDPEALPVQSAQPDVGFVTYGGSAEVCVQAAKELARREQLEVDVVVIERLWPFDGEPVVDLARRCRKIVVVEEGTLGWGFASECSRAILSAGVLDVSLTSVAGPDHPIPNSREWELQVLPNSAALQAAALRHLGF